MRNMKSNPKSTKFLWAILLIGYIGILVLFLNSTVTSTIFRLPKPAQSIYAIVYALICFFASYINNHRKHKQTGQLASLISLLPWFGMGGMGMAIYLAIVNLDTQNTHLGIFINYLFSVIGFTTAYLAIFTSLFPQMIQDVETQTEARDPYADLPKSLRKAVTDARTVVEKTTITTVAVFVGIAVISNILLAGSKHLLIFIGAEVFAGILIAVVARYVASQNWKKRALQSGISKKKLKMIAKLAGLSWPKIKEE
jgi:hypothetical protein